MSTGTYISGIAHVGLVAWLIVGWGLNNEPLDFEVTEVSVVTGEEFDALVRASTPDPDDAAPLAPVTPEIDDTTPSVEADEPPVTAPAPDPTEAPEEETPPPEAPAQPEPPTEVTDQVPDLPAVVVPPTSEATETPRPQPRPSPRVAPTPAAPTPPDVDVAEVERDAVTPADPTPAEIVEEPQDATAPEEAATEIVIEDEAPSGAVTTSLRPQTRPSRPAVTPAVEETPSTSDQDAVAAAVAAAAASSASSAPQGPPLTGSEKDAFRVAVNGCWNVDNGAEWARVTVVVRFNLTTEGKVEGNQVTQLSASGGTDAQINAAFGAARRAILRCQSSGYQLPADKYEQWKTVEITFDPTGMRLR